MSRSRVPCGLNLPFQSCLGMRLFGNKDENTVPLNDNREPVVVNVYDMMWTNDYTKTFGLGVYHSGYFHILNVWWNNHALSSRDLHRVPETKNTQPDPTQTRNRVGFGFENKLFPGSGRFSGFNFLVRVGFGVKNQLFFGKILKLA